MSVHSDHVPGARDARGAALDRKLEDVGWGLLLIMTGIVWLVPAEQVPRGTWLVGTGILLLALNAYRRLRGIAVHVLGAVLGALALAAGVGDLLAVDVPVFALALVALGGWLVLKPHRPA